MLLDVGSFLFFLSYLSMIEYDQINNVDYLVTIGGIDMGLKTPCAAFSFGKEVLDTFFKTTLPEYLKQLSYAWNQIEETRISGLMPIPSGGPIDDCKRDGVWDPDLQLAHGGPLPFLSSSKGSRGIPEVWPFARAGERKWEKTANGWKSASANVQANLTDQFLLSPFGAPGGSTRDAINLDLNFGKKKVVAQAGAKPIFAARCWRPHKKWQRTGVKRHRGVQDVSPRDPDFVTIFFANITELSAKAQQYVISRNDDVLLLAETHRGSFGTD